ncbi:MAG: hypothetical protein ABI581_10695 [Sediminibacterium sp.]
MKHTTFTTLLLVIFSLCTLLPRAVFSNPVDKDNDDIVVFLSEKPSDEISYSLERLGQALKTINHKLLVTYNKEQKANLIIKGISTNSNNDGYTITKTGPVLTLSAHHKRGIMYGVLEIAETLSSNKKWSAVQSKTVSARQPFRAIKFNLPWYSYRRGENLSLHYETCKDLKFWKAFLDTMVDNKFNTLTLWNLNPYIFMVTPKSFPGTAPFNPAEMAQWKDFYKSLFRMAKTRGIDTYIMNWNIFVSKPFAEKYKIANYPDNGDFFGAGETSDTLEQYMRELVTQTIDVYEDLSGIGISLGERMGEMTSEERREWIDRTIIKGMKNAKRPVKLIYRAPLSAGKGSQGTVNVSTEKLTRDAVESLGFEEPVLVDFKFNWSHAHSSPKLSIVHGGILTDSYWNPAPKNYKGVYTMRNEDFFVLRWAQPDFIRSFLKLNNQSYLEGVIVGSETYIPAKDYITRSEFRSWDYAFQRQWLFYKVWGNLLYDSSTPDSFFASALAKKFNLNNDGSALLKAWKLASMNANRMASFYQGTWDAALYTEGFTTVGAKFININELITHPVLDSVYVNVADFVNGKITNKQISPLQLADITEDESNKALKIAAVIRQKNKSRHLRIELTDIEAWAHHGKYFALKLRGAVALARYAKDKNEAEKLLAIKYLEEGLVQWQLLTADVEKYNLPVIPYQFDPTFSWRKHIADVREDIETAKKF